MPRPLPLLTAGAALAGALSLGFVVPAASASAAPSDGSAARLLTAPLAEPVWLCHPDDPAAACGATTARYPDGATVPLSTTVLAPQGAVVEEPAVEEPPVDCFYVYPTIDLLPNPVVRVGSLPPSARDDEIAVLLAQIGPLTGQCRIFAPLYRQSTLPQMALSALTGTEPYPGPGFADVQQAWDYYWAHDNVDTVTGQRRGVILLGHSQGSVAVEKLLQHAIDGDAEATAQLVSAVLLGGQVQVPLNAATGGGNDPASTFQHLPLCEPTATAVPVGCIIAYSSYEASDGGTPPAGSLAANLDSGHRIACVNPTAVLTGTPPDAETALQPILPTSRLLRGHATAPNGALTHVLMGYALPTDTTGYRSSPGALSGRCSFAGDATTNSSWLQISDHSGLLPDTSDSALGLHVVDYSVDLGDLRTLLTAQAERWAATRA